MTLLFQWTNTIRAPKFTKSDQIFLCNYTRTNRNGYSIVPLRHKTTQFLKQSFQYSTHFQLQKLKVDDKNAWNHYPVEDKRPTCIISSLAHCWHGPCDKSHITRCDCLLIYSMLVSYYSLSHINNVCAMAFLVCLIFPVADYYESYCLEFVIHPPSKNLMG